MADSNVAIRKLKQVKKVIAYKKIDPDTGLELLEPEEIEGDDNQYSENSLWFIEERK